MIKLSVPKEAECTRVDVFVAAKIGCSRSRIQQLIREGYVTLDGRPVKPSHILHTGERITIVIPEPVRPDITPEDIPLDVLFEDENLLVVNKPAGMVVHPAPGNYSGTLVNALLAHCKRLSGIGGVLRPGIIHRLDKDTSGLLVVAKDDRTHRTLAEELQERKILRCYDAFVWGIVDQATGSIEAPIGRHLRDRTRMAVTIQRRAKEALTEYTVTERFDFITRLSLRLKTGRTHQIRVHLSHMGHPIFGDPKYGGRNKRLKSLLPKFHHKAKEMLEVIRRQALHAEILGFIHPVTGEYLEFSSELPEDMKMLK
ncbi:MAG TPA: RluA family pseudouridine synthase, partial [Candidatus Latescibacteria bacterium]|nr:RluA family pseudouridine synthase [Candidatus Latescibacterota bacterium]